MMIGLICVLITGFSISRFIFYYRSAMDNGRLKKVMFVLAGVMISGFTLVLSVIALWPPLEPITFTLPFIFLMLLVGMVYFHQSYPLHLLAAGVLNVRRNGATLFWGALFL